MEKKILRMWTRKFFQILFKSATKPDVAYPTKDWTKIKIKNNFDTKIHMVKNGKIGLILNMKTSCWKTVVLALLINIDAESVASNLL